MFQKRIELKIGENNRSQKRIELTIGENNRSQKRISWVQTTTYNKCKINICEDSVRISRYLKAI